MEDISKFKKYLDDQLVVTHLGTLDDFDNLEDAVNALLEYERDLALYMKNDEIKKLKKFISAFANASAYVYLEAPESGPLSKLSKEVQNLSMIAFSKTVQDIMLGEENESKTNA